ncbi:MAG TPA: hypothetical protein VIE43_18780, partial [Thermoanaerobaculia bacterium]|nr:hypothetical protein [Thermoanaerobaculia bacterium]
ATTAGFELRPAPKTFAIGVDHPSAGDVPPSPWTAQVVVDGLGTSLQKNFEERILCCADTEVLEDPETVLAEIHEVVG